MSQDDLQEVWDSLKVESPSLMLKDVNTEGTATSLDYDALYPDVLDESKFLDDVEIQEHQDSLRSLCWRIPANRLLPLAVNGQIIRVRGIEFSVHDIAWKASKGSPIYRTPCPFIGRPAGSHFLVPGAPIHGIVMGVGCLAWYTCSYHGRAAGHKACTVVPSVNDDRRSFGKNQGGYTFCIHGWW